MIAILLHHPYLALLVWTVAALGAAYVVGHSVISRPLRVWLAPVVAKCPICGDTMRADFEGATCNGKPGNPPEGHLDAVMVLSQPGGPRFWLVTLLECPACFGWWLGFAAGLVLVLAGSPGPLWLPPLAGAFYTAGSNFLIGRAAGLMPDPN